MYYKSAFVRGKKPPFIAVLKYKDEQGVWRQKQQTLEAKTLTRAKQELKQVHLKAEQEHKISLTYTESTVTLIDFANNYVNQLEALKSLEKHTIQQYRYILRYVRDYFGGEMLASVTPEQIQLWEARLLEDLSSVTVRKMHVFLKSIFENAVVRDLIPKNPMVRIKPPKITAKVPNSLSNYERRRVLTYLDSGSETAVNLGILMALSTGMRQGEICALRWSDVDFSSGFLWVRHSLARDRGSYYLKPPKTPSSMRDIPIIKQLYQALERRKATHIKELNAVGMRASESILQSIFVLGEIDGRYMAPTTLSRSWKDLANSLGIIGTQNKRPTFHDLRHTFATFAISEGIDVKTVSSILGHANAAMTLNIYASADPDSKRAAAQTVDRVLSQRLNAEEIIQGRCIAPSDYETEPNTIGFSPQPRAQLSIVE